MQYVSAVEQPVPKIFQGKVVQLANDLQ